MKNMIALLPVMLACSHGLWASTTEAENRSSQTTVFVAGRDSAQASISDYRQRAGHQSTDYYALEKIENMDIEEADISHFLATGPQKK